MNIYSILSRLPNVALWLPVVQYVPTREKKMVVKMFWKNHLLIFLIRKKGIVHLKGEAKKMSGAINLQVQVGLQTKVLG